MTIAMIANDHSAAPHRDFLLPRVVQILSRAIHAFFADNLNRLGAALAFYTTLAVVPLVVLAIGIAGIAFEQRQARQWVMGEISTLVGPQASAAINSLQNPVETSTGTFTTVIGVVTLVFGAIGVFRHLQDALNSIWRVPAAPYQGWRSFLWARLFSVATVLMTGFLLIVSLIMSAVLSWLGARVVAQFALPVFTLHLVNEIFSFGVLVLLFALIFKLLPDTRVAWHHVWLGASVTSLLFTLGKTALGFYLGHARITSAYGAAGSLVVLLLWCYYAGQIVFFGAEFTRVTANSNGGRDFSALDVPRERRRSP